MSFLLLYRMIGPSVKQPVAINLRHVIAVHPATDFDHYGNAKTVDGADIWTTMESGSIEASPWRVVETYDEISRQVNGLIRLGGAA